MTEPESERAPSDRAPCSIGPCRLARLSTLLAPAPAAVTARILADASALKPGAAAAVGRFYATLKSRNEARDNPSRTTFNLVARSEPTLHTLLSALALYAPEVCLSAGRDARRTWYEARGVGPTKHNRRRGLKPVAIVAPQLWPRCWQALYPGLLRADVRETTRRRYVASISRCADLVGDLDCGPELTRWTAFCLMEALAAHRKKNGEKLTWTTIGNYLFGLEALAIHGGAPKAAVAGVAAIRTCAEVRGRLVPARKVARVQKLEEEGGYARLAEVAATLRDVAYEMPAWKASAQRLRGKVAVLLLAMNAPARTGDMSTWRLGEHLFRHIDGTWSLDWIQGKTATGLDLGELWPELSVVLDELLCAGRPDRFAAYEYKRLNGRNWLTHTAECPASRYASEMMNEAIGVPLHDIRTLAADHLRRATPASAARLIATLLGHAGLRSGDPYRAAADGQQAALIKRRSAGRSAGTGALARPAPPEARSPQRCWKAGRG